MACVSESGAECPRAWLFVMWRDADGPSVVIQKESRDRWAVEISKETHWHADTIGGWPKNPFIGYQPPAAPHHPDNNEVFRTPNYGGTVFTACRTCLIQFKLGLKQKKNTILISAFSNINLEKGSLTKPFNNSTRSLFSPCFGADNAQLYGSWRPTGKAPLATALLKICLCGNGSRECAEQRRARVLCLPPGPE